MSEALMTAEEAAERLGVHPETIRRAVRNRKLAHYRFAGVIRIAQDQLESYLEEHRCPALDPTDPNSSCTEEPGQSSGMTEASVDAFRRVRRMQSAVNKRSPTSKPLLRTVPQT